MDDGDGVGVDDVVRAELTDDVVCAGVLWLPPVAASATPAVPAATPPATTALMPSRISLPLFMNAIQRSFR